jgi:hypothetical protein
VLANSREMQELEVRKRLKLQRKGDTTIFLPDPPATPTPAK